MDNQHRKITGYRELQQHEIDLINEIKAEGERLQVLVNKVSGRVYIHETAAAASGADAERIREAEPMRWVAMARTDFQTGLMALTRAIAQPTSFLTVLRKLTVTIKIEAQAGDDSPLAPLVVEALQEFIAATNENSANAGKFESKAGLDVTWSARNEFFDDLGNQVHIADTGVAEAVGRALRSPEVVAREFNEGRNKLLPATPKGDS